MPPRLPGDGVAVGDEVDEVAGTPVECGAFAARDVGGVLGGCFRGGGLGVVGAFVVDREGVEDEVGGGRAVGGDAEDLDLFRVPALWLDGGTDSW